MLILSGDVGGTNSRLRLTEFASSTDFKILAEKTFLNQEHESFPEVVTLFLKEQNIAVDKIKATCFAVAGPVVGGTVKVTNLPWFVSEEDLRQELGLESVKLINDFEAIGYGIDTLQPHDRHILQKGDFRPKRPRAMIGAGTGLGVALSIPDEGLYRVMPTEGGHVDFAPTDYMQVKLLKYLQKKLHRVSVERVLSGQGIVNIYNFIRENPLFNEDENPALKRVLFKTDDAAAAITEYAINQHDPMAMRTLDLFIRIYGAAAGNLALTTLPFGGLYIVGGIAPKLLSQFLDGRFLKAFSDKGRMSSLLNDIPMYIVLNTNIGLQGAANYGYLNSCKQK